ncbi:MAG: hypothetical protein PVI30_06885 [Myxococcales bacterium]
MILALQDLVEMEHAFRPAHNPALMQQCAQLRTRITALQRRASEPAGVVVEPEATAGAFIAEGRGISALDSVGSRKRIERALSLVLAETGGESGMLLAVVRRGLTMLAPEPDGAIPEHVLDRVQRDIRDFERARRRASADLARAQATVTVGTLLEPSEVRPKGLDYATIVLSADGERAAGAVAAKLGPDPQPMDDALVRAISASLIESGDPGDPRATAPLGRPRVASRGSARR